MKTSFGNMKDGREVSLYTIENANGMKAALTDIGATLVSLLVKDRRGIERDMVLGHVDATGYEDGHGSIGGTVGRFANRIGGGRFTLNGRTYELTRNNGPNTLHGGCDPFTKRLWNAADVSKSSVTFTLKSPDGDQGFPGNMEISVAYSLDDEDTLHIDYAAKSDLDTPLNLTNHSYFNLAGTVAIDPEDLNHPVGETPGVLDQIAWINAVSFTPNDDNSLPTGEIRQVAGTPFDFRIPKALGVDIAADYNQLAYGSGYDHNFVIDGEGYREAAALFCEKTGIRMTVMTDLPGMQLYTANHLKDEPGKYGDVYMPRCAVCFETQFFPDAVNREDFPGGVLRAGEVYRSRTSYKFEIADGI